MSFLDFLTGKIKCPSCGTAGAKKSATGFRCPNPNCQWYDRSLEPKERKPDRGPRTPRTGEPLIPEDMASKLMQAQSGFSPARTITIRYRNFRGEEKTFTADPESAVRKKKHLSLRVAPTGARIVLARDRIQNPSEVDDLIPQPVAPGQDWPTSRELQVLNYHKRYKTSSPLYEKIRAKYPNW
jgi:hypothetical protein